MNEDCDKDYNNVILDFLKIREVRADLFYILIKKRDYEIFAIIIKDIKKTLKPKFYIDPRFFVFEEYYDLIDIFKKNSLINCRRTAINMILR